MKLFKTLIACFVVFLACAPGISAPTGIQDGSTEVRSAAVLTNSDTLSTTFTMAPNLKAVHFFVDFTKGSLTSASFAPAGALTGNPAAAGYYKATGSITTIETTGKYHIRIPRENFGAYRYGGIFALGIGTASGSSATIRAKFEY